MDLENNSHIRGITAREIHPDPEKFWITYQNYSHQNAVNKVIINRNVHTPIDFFDTSKRPTDFKDPSDVFEIRMMRFIADSKILDFIPEPDIQGIELIRIYDIENIEYPKQDYYIYVPTINMLFLEKNMRLDQSVMDSFPLIMTIKIL